MADKTLSLHRKLAQIMWDAERIPKRGKAPAVMGGYPFVQVGDAADFVRKALAEHVLSMLPTAIRIVGQVDRETAKGGNMTTVDLITTWTITDGESGESITFESFGAGADGGDKYSGKASTSAMKYALLTAFLLSTGDDTEAHATPDQRPVGSVPAERPAPEHLPPREGSLIGVAEAAKPPHDFELRQSPDGPMIGFALKEGREIVRVIAYGQVAKEIAAFQEAVEGRRIIAFGSMTQESWTVGAGTAKERNVPYTRLNLTRLTGPEGLALPMPTEAPTAPLFEDDPELDAALARVP